MNCCEFKHKERSLFKIISEDSVWEDMPDYFKDTNTQPNKRFSVVFRDNFDNLTAHYSDGKVFSDTGGRYWFTRKRSEDYDFRDDERIKYEYNTYNY